jgi:hypothetical protein
MKHLAQIGLSRTACTLGSDSLAAPGGDGPFSHGPDSGSSRKLAISQGNQTATISAAQAVLTAAQLHPLSISVSTIAVVEPPTRPRWKRANRADFGIAPRMLTKELAAAYCGVSSQTFSAICPVAPIAMGKGDRLWRYDIRQLDRWIDGLGGRGEHRETDWLAEMDRDDGIGCSRKRH